MVDNSLNKEGFEGAHDDWIWGSAGGM